MQFVSDWRRVLKRARSMHFAYALATLIILVDPLMALLVDLSAGWGFAIRVALAVLSGLLSLGVIWARIVKQKDFEDE